MILKKEEQESWNHILSLMKKEPEHTFECIGWLQLIVALIATNREAELQKRWLNHPQLAIYKNKDKEQQQIAGTLSGVPFAELYEKAQVVGEKDCDEQFYKYFQSVEQGSTVYVGVKYKKDETMYFIVYGIQLGRAKKRLVETEKKLIGMRWIVFAISFVVWWIILAFVEPWSYRKVWYIMFVYLLLGIAVGYFNTLSVIEPLTYEKELSEKSNLNQRSLAVASISIGLTFVVNFIRFNSNLYIRCLLVSFMFSLLSITIPNQEKTGKAVRQSIIVQKGIINFSIAFLFLALFSFVCRNVRA
jgi:hypothetical protein